MIPNVEKIMNRQFVNLYEILEINPKASQAEIKRAFRKLAFRCHPDHNPGDLEAAKKFRMVTLAYEILGDPRKRARYDTFYGGRLGKLRGKKSDPYARSDGSIKAGIFSDEFTRSILAEYFGITATSHFLNRGMDLCFYLQVEQKTASEGGREAIYYSRMIFCDHCYGNGKSRDGHAETCETCHGNGFKEEHRKLVINIPPGSNDGDRLYFRSMGDQNFAGMPPGDLVVVIKVC